MKEFQPYFYLDQVRPSNRERGNIGYILIFVGIIFLVFDFFAKLGMRDFSFLIIGLGITFVIFGSIITTRPRIEEENKNIESRKEEPQGSAIL
jgi:membrane-bound ClpP family serine protease